ncbi:MAG: hypothetical protein IKS60_03545 [Lachnospiraceae bacterium]|nr:hypothetical protein [Lachnospiraceae bacterium]MBR4412664.1 hypothetical protein [Lachnospiraceae bacterium]
MGDSGIVISDRLIFLCKCNQLNKIYDVENSQYSELLLDMFESKYKIFDYPAGCNKAYERTKIQKRIALHIKGEKVSISWIQKYCKFFGCSSDYLLGLIDTPTHELEKIKDKSGLSAITCQRLKNDKEIRLLINALVQSNAIKYFLGTIRYDHYISRHNEIFLNEFEKTDIPQKNDFSLQRFKDCLKDGNIQRQKRLAYQCYQRIADNEDIKKYINDSSDFSQM